MSMPFVEVRGLHKTFVSDTGWFTSGTSITAVDNVDLSIARGSAHALVGESGSGKTTLGRCLLRLIEPDAGHISIDGTDVCALRGRALRAFRKRMQIVFQDPSGSLNPRMRVGNAVREPLEIHRIARGAGAKERVAELFAEVGLDPDLYDRFPHELSGGQKQRVGIARALAVDPDFIVLDEPVSALDVSVQAQIINLLEDLRRARDLTYLLIAHDLSVVRQVADAVSVMYFGRIVETGSADQIYETRAHPYTQALLSAVPVPDPEQATTRVVIDGEPPDPAQPPPGCAFYSRCQHEQKHEGCTAAIPPMTELADGHRAACILASRT